MLYVKQTYTVWADTFLFYCVYYVLWFVNTCALLKLCYRLFFFFPLCNLNVFPCELDGLKTGVLP